MCVCVCAEQYTPSPYSDPNYKPQQGYPAPTMDISQPVSYPQHAVRTITSTMAIQSTRTMDGCRVRFFSCASISCAICSLNNVLPCSTGVANGSSLINMAAILSSNSAVRSDTRHHITPTLPRYMHLLFQGRNMFRSAVNDVPQQAAGPSPLAVTGLSQSAVVTGRVPCAASSAATQQADGAPGYDGRMSGCHLLLRPPHRWAILGGQ